MSFGRKHVLLAVGVLAAAAVAAGLWWFLWRPANAARMVALLPAGDAPLLYVDVGLLRQTGLLDQLAGQAGLEEAEYRRFVEASGFDYRRDLDAVALLFRKTDRLMVAAGRFDLEKLALYAKASGGRCAGSLCSMQGSSPDRQVSWMPLGRGLMGVAVSPDPMAAALMGNGSPGKGVQPPVSVLWLHIPGTDLRPGASWPPGVSALLSGLEGADRVMLKVGIQGSGLVIELEAPCPSAGKAGEVVARLDESTGMLKKLLAKENRQHDPKDLSAVLAGGAFEAEGSVVRGTWPVSRAFIDSLAR